jgi:homeobox protein HoxA/B/C/D4
MNLSLRYLGMKLDKRIEEAVPAGQQLQELGMRLRCLDDGSSDQVSVRPHLIEFQSKQITQPTILQDDILDEEEDRLIMDRSPQESASPDDDLDDMESDDDMDEAIDDGERIIYPWMKKVHVAGVGECSFSSFFFSLSILFF